MRPFPCEFRLRQSVQIWQSDLVRYLVFESIFFLSSARESGKKLGEGHSRLRSKRNNFLFYKKLKGQNNKQKNDVKERKNTSTQKYLNLLRFKKLNFLQK